MRSGKRANEGQITEVSPTKKQRMSLQSLLEAKVFYIYYFFYFDYEHSFLIS